MSSACLADTGWDAASGLSCATARASCSLSCCATCGDTPPALVSGSTFGATAAFDAGPPATFAASVVVVTAAAAGAVFAATSAASGGGVGAAGAVDATSAGALEVLAATAAVALETPAT